MSKTVHRFEPLFNPQSLALALKTYPSIEALPETPDLIKLMDILRGENNWLILDGADKLGDSITAPRFCRRGQVVQQGGVFHFGGSGSEGQGVTTILVGLPMRGMLSGVRAIAMENTIEEV